MSISVKFYTFSKPKNDVVQPTGVTANISADVLIKEPCDVLYPTLLLKTTSSPVSSNYCYISDFGRYYFIKTWISDHGLWEAQCVVDPLASWKTEILGTTQYVMRSSSEYNEYIPDGEVVFSKNTKCTDLSIVTGHHDPIIGNDYCYVLQISNDYSPKINGVQYVVVSKSTMETIVNTILNNTNTFGFGLTEAAFGLTASVARAIVNPLQYIGNAYLLPVALSDLTGTQAITDLNVGFWPLASLPDMYAFNCDPNSAVYTDVQDLDLTANPYDYSHGKWLNGYPFTKYTLYAGPFGSLNLNNDIIVDDYSTSTSTTPGKVTAKIHISMDFLGRAVLTINYDNKKILAKTYANLAIQIPLTQTKSNYIDWYSTLVGSAGSFMKYDAFGAAQQQFSCISNLGLAYPHQETIGQQGSCIQSSEIWRLQSQYMTPAALTTGSDGRSITKNKIGVPLCEVKLLSDLSGFCQVEKPHLNGIPCYDIEKDMIANYMTNGLFLGAGGV